MICTARPSVSSTQVQCLVHARASTLGISDRRYQGLLLAGVGQEAFQLLYKGRLLLFNDVRDLATDLLGLLLASVIVWVWGRLRRRDR